MRETKPICHRQRECLLAALLGALLAGTAVAQQQSIHLGDVTAEPGQIVDVPILGTFEGPLIAYSVVFRFDRERLSFLEITPDGTPWEAIPPEVIFFLTDPSGATVTGIRNDAILEQFRLPPIPPGDDVLIGTLRFRVRATSEAGGAVITPIPGGGADSRIESEFRLASGDSFLPDEYRRGAVEVVVPDGPRPVGDLACEQFLDRTLLSFTPTEPYDSIEIRREGELLAMLAGDVTSYSDPLEGRLGPVEYSVTAIAGASPSFGARCVVVAKTPVAPRVTDFQCSNGQLRWTNTASYDRLELFKDAVLLTELPGDASSFTDPRVGDEQTSYTLVAELEGISSAPVSCLANGLWIMEAQDVQVPADAERVSIPIFSTNSGQAVAVQIELQIDKEKFSSVSDDPEAALAGTISEGKALDFLGLSPHPVTGLPSVGMIYDVFPPLDATRRLQVGVKQRVFNFILDITGEFEPGDTVAFAVTERGNTTYTTRTGNISQDRPPDFTLGGRIFFGESGVEPVRNLQTVVENRAGRRLEKERIAKGPVLPSTRDIALEWENAADYDRIIVERNGEIIEELPGSSTSYVDPDLLRGFYTYKISGVVDDRESFPVSGSLLTDPPLGSFIRADVNDDGVRDISDAVTILLFLFIGGVELRCQKAADVDDNGLLDISDPVFLLASLFVSGAPIPPPGPIIPFLDPSDDDISCGK